MSLLDLQLPIHNHSLRYPQRFVVDSSFKTQFTGLKCDWPSFVYLALALGVSAYDNGLLQIRRRCDTHFDSIKEVTLYSITDQDLIEVSFTQGTPVGKLKRKSKFSLRRALAWDLVMAVPSAQGVMELVPLIPPTSFSENDESKSCCVAPGCSSSSQREMRYTKNRLEAALTWVLYVEQTLRLAGAMEPHLLPIPQDVLEIRMNTAVELRTLEHLNSRLAKIFPSDTVLTKRLTEILQPSQESRAFPPPNNQHQRSVDNDFELDIWPALRDNTTFQALRRNFDPSPHVRTNADVDLNDTSSDISLLARIIIVTSTARKWKKREWITDAGIDGRVRPVMPANPMVALFDKGDRPPPQDIYFG